MRCSRTGEDQVVSLWSPFFEPDISSASQMYLYMCPVKSETGSSRGRKVGAQRKNRSVCLAIQVHRSWWGTCSKILSIARSTIEKRPFYKVRIENLERVGDGDRESWRTGGDDGEYCCC